MKKLALGLAAVALIAAGAASAAKKVDAPAPDSGAGATQPTYTSGLTAKEELGCKIVLCMANPNGPSAVAECADAIKERARLIAKGKPIPKCPGYNTADTGGGGNTGGGGSRDDNTRTQQN